MWYQGEGLSCLDGFKSAFWPSSHSIFLSYAAQPKPTPVPTPAPVDTSSAPPETALPSQPSIVTGAAPTEATPAPSQDVPSQAPSSASAPAFGDPSSFLSGDGLQAAVNNMVEMGFPKEQVLRAMRASFNNPDRAVEYLMTVS